MRPLEPDELDPAAVAAAYERRIAAISPEHVRDALRLLGGLDPNRWRLEWHLPLWLGNAFGLDRDVSTEIAVTNVLGLASLRLRDDLVDGDVGDSDAAGAPALIETLYEASIEPYRSRFPPGSRFWSQLDQWMGEWKAATEETEQPQPADGAWSPRQLSRRGAPLKISAYAVCLLTRRSAAFANLEWCLDHALAAMVLYDHACDWQDDLASGRWNALVAATGTSQRADAGEGRRNMERARAETLAALMTGDAIERLFRAIRTELDEALAMSDRVGVPGLSAHLRVLATQLDADGGVMRARYGELGERAAAALFGDHPLAKRGMLRTTARCGRGDSR